MKYLRIAPFAVLALTLALPAYAQFGNVTNIDSNGNATLAPGPTDSPSPTSYPPSSNTFPTGSSITPTSGSSGINTSYLEQYSNDIIDFIDNVAVPVLFAVAFIFFLYGVFKYFILGATSEDARREGGQFVLWGVIGFVVIISVWGLVNIALNTLGLTAGGTAPPPPTL